MKYKMILSVLLSILIVIVSWIMNYGFMRMFFTFTLIPFVHIVVMLAIGFAVVNYADYNKIRVYNLLFCITYVLSNVLYPDADEGAGYMFFGLIKNDFVCMLGESISIILFIIHIVLLVLQILEIRRIDKERNKD